MGLTGSIIIFLLIWWLIFFISLPIKITSTKPENVREGDDPGAPSNPHIFWKFLITTFVSGVLWAIIYFAFSNDGFLMFILKLFYIDEII